MRWPTSQSHLLPSPLLTTFTDASTGGEHPLRDMRDAFQSQPGSRSQAKLPDELTTLPPLSPPVDLYCDEHLSDMVLMLGISEEADVDEYPGAEAGEHVPEPMAPPASPAPELDRLMIAHIADAASARFQQQLDTHSVTQMAAHQEALALAKSINVTVNTSPDSSGLAASSLPVASLNPRLSLPQGMSAYLTPDAGGRPNRRTSFSGFGHMPGSSSNSSSTIVSPPLPPTLPTADRGGSAKSDPKDKLSPIEHEALATIARERMLRSLKEEVKRLRASHFGSLIIQVTRQLVARPLSYVAYRLSYAELLLVLLLSYMLGPRLAPIISAASRSLLSSLRLRLVNHLGNNSLSFRTRVATALYAAALRTGHKALTGPSSSGTPPSTSDAPPSASDAPPSALPAPDSSASSPAAPTEQLDDVWNLNVNSNGVLMVSTSGGDLIDHTDPDLAGSIAATRVGRIGSDYTALVREPSSSSDTTSASTAGSVMLLQSQRTALLDSGATIECCKDSMGAVPGTFESGSNGSLSVADESSSLVSLGADVRALCRTDSLGQQQDFAALMHQTPKIIVDVLAEGIECNIRNTRIEWCPQQPKVLHTASGLSLFVSMTKSALCMITISPLTGKQRLAALIKSSPLLRDRVIPAAV